jgi:hypothetical protein
MRARARYDAGTRAFAEGRIVEAALQFEAAAVEKASPIALYSAALAWERANVPQRAADDYTRAIALGGLAQEATSLATHRLEALEAVLGAVLVSGPAGWRAQLDANTELPLPATLHGASGVHTLTVRALGRAIAPVTVVLKPGIVIRMQLPEPGNWSGEEVAPRPVGRDIDARRVLGLVTLGAAGGATLEAVLLGALALDARDAYRAGPTQASYDHAQNLERWTDAAWIAAGVLAASGLALVLWPAPRGNDARARAASVHWGLGPANVFVAGAFE